MKVLFLNPPSYEGFDGGAGSRYQAKREIRSFWYPTWLAQPAAMIKDSKLIDAPAHDLLPDDVLKIANGFDMCIVYTSTPSFNNDLQFCGELKEMYPSMIIGFVGAHVAVLPEESLKQGEAIDFVARKEFEYAIKEIAEGKPFSDVLGISYKNNETVVHNKDREAIQNLDELPHVIDVYKRDLIINKYYIGYLKHPYISLYTGRGCPSKCTFCLWPQTIGGHTYRVRSPQNVYEEIKKGKEYFPEVKEFFFDDDTFTANLPRAEEVARLIGKLGVTWSCNAKANVPYESMKKMKEKGLRLFLVGFESGNQKILNNIRKGIRIDIAREFMKNCKKLGIKVHGTFVLGLPGETPETIKETIRFVCDIDPDTIQVSLAAPYPGTELYKEAQEKGWFVREPLVDSQGIQSTALEYPEISHKDIFHSVEQLYKRFYFRPRPILRIVSEMLKDKSEMTRRLREGHEFFKFMWERKVSARN